MSRRAGRRPGSSGTRQAIENAARRNFGELGYERTTIRAIAEEAGVDPALVVHFFGSKQQLFLAVIDLPFAPEEVLPSILAGDRDGVGERFARFIVGVLEDESARSVVTGMVRAATSEPEAARMLRELISRRVFAAIAASLGAEDAELRATLVGSQVVGLVVARYIVAVEPLASLDPERLVAAVAPNFQRYLVGSLTD
jgi:AcrR family transcriptional regulator